MRIRPSYNFDPEYLPEATGDFFAKLALNIVQEPPPIREFVRDAWPIIEPANPLQDEYYVDYICEYLELVTTGEIRKLLINMPPREGKSNLVNVCWPAWSWIMKPFLRFLTCSYSASLSVKHAIMRRNIITSLWYQKNWGDTVRLAPDQNQKQEYENTARGFMIASSVDGTITGKGGDVLIEDDLINPKEAESTAERERALMVHQAVLASRLDNPKTGARVIVEQRTHAQDLTNHVLTNEDGWVHVSLPMECERKTIIVFPKSKKQIVRQVGDVLSPLRHGPVEIKELKKAMGSRVYSAQCQQNPTADVGNILKRTWWKKYKVLPTGMDMVITSWDMNFQETKQGSYVCGHAYGKRGADFYLLPIEIRERMDFAETLPAVENLPAQIFKLYRFTVMANLVERKANGAAILSSLIRKVRGLIPIEPYGSKASRAQAIAPVVEAGNVHIPDESLAAWVPDFVEECAKFRGVDGEINDRVDVLSQAINWFCQLPVIDPDELEDEGDFVEGGMEFTHV